MSKQTVDVTGFSTRGDGISLDTTAIQSAIDSVANSGGGVLRFPAGTYRSGTLFLRSNVALHFDRDATLLGSDRLEDYCSEVVTFVDAVGQQRGRCLIMAHNAHNVGLDGEGTIDGNGAAFVDPAKYPGRPFLVRFVNCTDISVKNVTLKNSAAWVSHYERCDRVVIDNVTIRSRVNHNNDGIDIDSCADVLVSNCDIQTGDDALCLKATTPKACENVRVQNCRLSSGCGAIKLGTESYGDFRNIHIHDCQIHDTGLCGIKVISMDGAIIEDVTISDITMVRTTGPIFIRLGDRGRTYGENNATRRPPGRIRRLILRDINADISIPTAPVQQPYSLKYVSPQAFSGITITGIPGHPIEELVLENVEINFAGGGTLDDSANQPTEQIGDYPEHFYFGILPAWGLFLRHVAGARFLNTKISTQRPDPRPSLVCEDVTGLRLDKWQDDPNSRELQLRFRNTRDVSLDGKVILPN